MMMPESTVDLDLGMIAAIIPAAEGSDKQKFVALPFVSATWSSGVFLSPGELGMRLPSAPHIQYGPLLAYAFKSRRGGTDAVSSLVLEPGVYFNYRFDQRLGIRSSLMYGGGDRHRGARLHLAVWGSTNLSPHQSLVTEIGLAAADRPYMQSYFGISPEQARTGQYPAYVAQAGIKSSYLQIAWNTELTRKHDLSVRLIANKLSGSAAYSPLTTRANTISLVSAITYHY